MKIGTFEDHLELAKHVRIARKHLWEAMMLSSRMLGKSSPPAKRLWTLLRPGGKFDLIRHELDNLFHKASTYEQFSTHGHVYFQESKEHDL